MPLDRAHVTIASRVMLRVYPLFAAGVGVSLAFTPRARLLATPTFRYLDGIVSLRAWGVAFLGLAVVLAFAWVSHKRELYQVALSLMLVWMGIYTVVTLFSAIQGQASFAAWTWPAFIMCACWASLLSLWARER